jgi:hypothetical protein
MAVAPRIVNEPTIKQLVNANSANIAVTSEILDIAAGLDDDTKKKLVAAVTKVLNNSDAITSALLSAPSARS